MGSDYGATGWAEDADKAHAQAVSWIGKTASAKGWDKAWSDYAYGLTSTAYARADGDAGEYWSELVTYWTDGGVKGGSGMDGWDDLGNAFASAGHTSYTTEAGRDSGGLVEMLKGTVEGAVEDIGGGLTWWGRYGKWVMGAGAIAAAWWFLGRRR